MGFTIEPLRRDPVSFSYKRDRKATCKPCRVEVGEVRRAQLQPDAAKLNDVYLILL